MAQKITVALEDDLTGGPVEETVRFAFDGTEYEIGLNAKNAAALRKHPRPMPGTPQGRAVTGLRGRRTAASRQRSGDIRAWGEGARLGGQ